MDMPDNSYAKYEAMKKLGDRAFTSKQFEKAIQYYEQAVQSFNIPNHPKTLAALDGIRKAKNAISARSGNGQPKTLVIDGLVKPLSFHMRLYCNHLLPESKWEDFVIHAFEVSREGIPLLKKMIYAVDTIPEFHHSWEFIPYFQEDFTKVANERSRTFFESLATLPDLPLVKEITADLNIKVNDQPTQAMLFIAVFGKELLK